MLTAAQKHYLAQQRLARQAAARARQTWTRLLDPQDLTRSYSTQVQKPLLALVTASQVAAAAGADGYVDTALREQDIDLDRTGSIRPDGFGAGRASDGRPLASLLLEPVITIKRSLLEHSSLDDALAAGMSSLLRIVLTQVIDAGRTATGAALVARPAATGYVRVLDLPSCSRCLILAGRYYRWSSGFQRHPHCDCQHVPTTHRHAPDLTTDPMQALRAGQVTGLSTADRKAIDDGADLNQVVNAHRGMSTADVYGRQLKVTNEGVTVRGRAGRALKDTGGSYTKTPRLRPESIYALADDRDDALRLLRRYGYLT